jgi:hypothetical protein
MRHRLRTMSIPTREATSVPLTVRGVDTEGVTGVIITGTSIETFLRHSGPTNHAIHYVRLQRSRHSFEKDENGRSGKTISMS